ncbi:hypothetical protein D9M72_528330 [compost metagenome]
MAVFDIAVDEEQDDQSAEADDPKRRQPRYGERLAKEGCRTDEQATADEQPQEKEGEHARFHHRDRLDQRQQECGDRNHDRRPPGTIQAQRQAAGDDDERKAEQACEEMGALDDRQGQQAFKKGQIFVGCRRHARKHQHDREHDAERRQQQRRHPAANAPHT